MVPHGAHDVRRPTNAKTTELDRAGPEKRRLPAGAWALVLRAIVGFGFMAHGLAKISRGSDVFAAILHALGVPAPHVMAWLTILVELGGGFAVLIGAMVSIVAIPMVVVLLVAMFTVHLRYGFSSIKLIAVSSAGPQFGPPGYEINLLYIACLVALVIGGSGPLSIDSLVARRERHRGDTEAHRDGSLP